jgi:hypothetical protein
VLEDRFVDDDKRRALWAAIRSRGGALRTPYGMLVGSASGVLDVLSDDERCSVRAYYHRMKESVGPLYLGMDRCPVRKVENPTKRDEEYENEVHVGAYDAQATDPNRYMSSITRSAAFEAAREAAEMLLTGLAEEDQGEHRTVDLRQFAAGTVGVVSRVWFGMPVDPTDRSQFRDVFLAAAQNIFYPHPEPAARSHAQKVPGVLDRLKLEERALDSNPDMLAYLPAFDDKEKQRALLGGAQGFVVATVTSFIGVAKRWLDDQRLNRLAGWMRTDRGRPLWNRNPTEEALGDDVELVAEMLATLRRAPSPDILHRTAVRAKALAGGAAFAKPGDTVVVSLASALADDPAAIDLLFGGSYRAEKSGNLPVHACPGKEAALGVMLGLFVTLLTKDELKREGILAISYNPEPPWLKP